MGSSIVVGGMDDRETFRAGFWGAGEKVAAGAGSTSDKILEKDIGSAGLLGFCEIDISTSLGIFGGVKLTLGVCAGSVWDMGWPTPLLCRIGDAMEAILGLGDCDNPTRLGG